jgi:hypothetical protein
MSILKKLCFTFTTKNVDSPIHLKKTNKIRYFCDKLLSSNDQTYLFKKNKIFQITQNHVFINNPIQHKLPILKVSSGQGIIFQDYEDDAYILTKKNKFFKTNFSKMKINELSGGKYHFTCIDEDNKAYLINMKTQEKEVETIPLLKSNKVEKINCSTDHTFLLTGIIIIK